MARNKLAGVASSITGTQIALVQATDTQGDAVRPNNKIWIHNGTVADITITLVTGGTTEGLDVADPTVIIPDGEGRIIGPFPAVFPQTSGADKGWVYINYSSVAAGVTRAVLA